MARPKIQLYDDEVIVSELCRRLQKRLEFQEGEAETYHIDAQETRKMIETLGRMDI